MFEVRRWSEQDREHVVAVRNAVYPEYQNERETWLAAHQLDAPQTAPHRWVIEEHATRSIIAYAGNWPWNSATGRYRLDLIVHPRRQRRGAGDLLLVWCLDELRRLRAQSVQARVRDDHPEGLAFLEKRGFIETQRMHGLVLDVRTADAELIRSSVQRVAAQGIEIRSMAEIGEDSETLMLRLHDLHNAVLPDWPDPDPSPFRSVPFDDFRSQLAQLSVRPDDVLLALDQARFVGYCILSFGTAVRPDDRGRGIATALKAYAIKKARHHGVRKLFTCTASPAMRHINETLGYRRVRTEIRLVKQV